MPKLKQSYQPDVILMLAKPLQIKTSVILKQIGNIRTPAYDNEGVD